MRTTSRVLERFFGSPSEPFAVIPSKARNLALSVRGKLREESGSENAGKARFLASLGMTGPGLLGASVVLTMLLGTLGTSYATERAWEREFPLPPAGRVSVENVHGAIWIEVWDQSKVEATVLMRSSGKTDRLDDVQVAVEARSGSLAFHTLYPGDLDVPVQVDYHLRVPRQAHLEQLSTLEGGIAVHDVEGPVSARSLHGDIEGVDLAGAVEARALTGNIRVSWRSLPCPTDRVKLETVSGDVILQLPPRADADLELATVAGHILGRYAFQASAVPGDATRRVHLGDGGVRIRLRTVRGDIQVAERPEEL